MHDPRLDPTWTSAANVERDATDEHDGQEDTEANKGEYLNEVRDPDQEAQDGRTDD